MTETVFVTGAGGFLGGTIVEALFFGGKYQVRAGLVRWLSAPRVARLPIELVQCDVLKPTELTAAFSGVDYVIHCAVGNEKVTVLGTKNVIQAAAAAGVKRIVHISTASIYGEAQGDVTEDTQPVSLDDYGKWKSAAEAAYQQGEVEAVILRPSIIYGPFALRWTMLYAQRLKAGWKHLGSLGTGTCNLIHAHDVARYAIASISQDGLVGQAFNINGPAVMSWNDYLDRFNAHLGLPIREQQAVKRTQTVAKLAEVVRALGKYALQHHGTQLRWVAGRSSKIKRLMELTELNARLATSQYELALFKTKARYRTDKADRAFGFQPLIDVDTGLAMTVQWLDHMGEAA